MKFNNTQELFESFPNIVLLVGNGNTFDSKELIDSYECVIRFNDFVIDGYERDVGTKVNAISFHSSNLNQNHTKKLISNYEKYIENTPIFTTLPYNKDGKDNILQLDKGTSLLSVSPVLSNSPRNRLSSGISLAINLSLFFNKEVHLIGFDFWESGHYYNKNYTKDKVAKSQLELDQYQLINKISTIKLL
jgi:hypothetical protein